MYGKPLVPDDFDVPAGLETERMRLRKLTVHDAVKDYDAVMSSSERLRTVFRPGGDWPLGLTLDVNIQELGWHQTEFELRKSFAYTVVSLDESQVLGCLYIYPTDKGDFDAMLTCWVRQSEAESGLDEHLYGRAKSWIASDWPFAKVAFVDREIGWDEFEALPGSQVLF